MEPSSQGREEPREIVLPKQLEEVEPAGDFTRERHRWNTNEEIASILLAFSKHKLWQLSEVQTRPANGSMLLYSRKHVRYRQDGYCWKKRKDGRTTREDHMKLKVRGVECIYGCYVHSAILPTFHRRCYWLLQNRDLVLVHYLNTPNTEDNKEAALPSLQHCPEKREWTREELAQELTPMYASPKTLDSPVSQDTVSSEMIQAIVSHVLETRQQKTRPKTHDCLCRGTTGGGMLHSPECTHTKCRIISPKGSQTGVPASAVQNRLLELIHRNKKENGIQLAPHHGGTGVNAAATTTTTSNTPLILNFSPSANGLIILSGQNTAPFSFINRDGSLYSAGTSSNQATMTCIQRAVQNNCDKGNPSQLTHVSNAVSKESHVSEKPIVRQSSSFEEQNNLQLSADELHQTLSANLPSLGKPSAEFQQSSRNLRTITTPSPQGSEFNLDAFDYLDLPDFSDISLNSVEDMQTSQTPHDGASGGRQQPLPAPQSRGVTTKSAQGAAPKVESREGIANITDFTPEWSFTEGGTKLLIIGPWYSTTSPYTCLFDDVTVPAALVQNGVLRCFAPAHCAGLVTLQVACEGHVISSACAFEYKTKSSGHCLRQPWMDIDVNQLQAGLLQRLQDIEKRLTPVDNSYGQFNPHANVDKIASDDPFEDRVLHTCSAMQTRGWATLEHVSKQGSYKGMTLLHFAAALGYEKLIRALIQWRHEVNRAVLSAEVDALSVDGNSSTPLLWSCGLGRASAAQVLYQWDRSAMEVCDKNGFTPVTIAHCHGYSDLAQSLLDMEKSSSATLLPLSPNLDALTTGDSFISTTPTHSVDSSFTSSSFNTTQATDSSISDISFSTTMPQVGSNHFSNLSVDIPTQPLSNMAGSASVASPIVLTDDTKTGKKRTYLTKQFSVGPALEGRTSTTPQSIEESRNLRSVNSDPHLNLLDDISISNSQKESLNLVNRFFVMDKDQQLAVNRGHFLDARKDVAMETDDIRCSSPYIDVETVSDEEAQDPSSEKMVNLATQIIAAIPERIKLSPSRSDDFDVPRGGRERSSSRSSFSSHCSSAHTPPQVHAEDSGICTPMGDNSAFDEGRYPDLGTPTSCQSPASPCLASPYSFALDSPPPTKEDFREYFNAPAMFLEQDFSLLTLSDQEQRNLFEAAKIIQDAFRQYKTKLQNKMHKEREVRAAILIQSYYRRYKQYAYYKRMSEAAVTIQSQFRTYYAQKRFKKSQDAARIIQNQYRTYKEHERFKRSRNAAVIIQQRFRTHYQRKRNQERNKSVAGASSQRAGQCGTTTTQPAEVTDHEEYMNPTTGTNQLT